MNKNIILLLCGISIIIGFAYYANRSEVQPMQTEIEAVNTETTSADRDQPKLQNREIKNTSNIKGGINLKQMDKLA